MLPPSTETELQAAAQAILQGGLVAYPTEAVYGLGCDPENQAAVLNLLTLKKRPIHKGLILIGASLEQLLPWVTLTSEQTATVAATWPGPTTWVVPASAKVPTWVRGEHSTVAIRVSGHPVARRLCDIVGKPIISTSANPSGQPPARSHKEAQQYFSQQLDSLVSGQCDITAKPSTIIELQTGATLRG